MTQFEAPPTYDIDGQVVILDSDLARVFDVETKALNQQVKRYKARIEDGGAFKLTPMQCSDLKSQNVTASSSDQHFGRRTPPRVFTQKFVTTNLFDEGFER